MSRPMGFLLVLLWGVLGVAGLFPALFSVMIFDAPGSRDRIANQLLFYALATLPISCSLSAIAAAGAAGKRPSLETTLPALLPLINLVIGILAFWWIESVQGGRFNG